MSFLNGALAFGAFAFTVPLIIHLFFRSRFKKLEWGAMYLLENVVRVNRRRMQLTNLLLLLLRCLIPVLLALCLARPVLNGFQALAGDAPKTLVIALDDTRSMAATPPGEEARIERAKKELRQVLDDLSRKDEVILVRSSRLGAVPATMGASDAVTALRRVTASGGAVAIGDLLAAAYDAAESGTHSRRQILLVSDFQSNAVGASTLEQARQISENRSDDESQGAPLPAIDLFNLGGGSEDLANVSIDDLSTDSPVVVAERSSAYSAVIRNSADLPANDLRVIWSIDGEPLEPRLVSVDAKSTKTNRLTHTIDEPGVHEVSLSVERGDVLAEDNRRSLAVEVIREVNVLLIDGRPSRQPLAGQADYLAIALSPFAFGGDDRPDPVRAAVIHERDLRESLSANPVRVVILASVGRLGEQAKSALSEFVNDGGSLVVFDGPATTPDLYNESWGSESVLQFPARLGDVMGEPRVGSHEPEQTFSIDAPTQAYEPWRILARTGENPFSTVKVFAYRMFELPEQREDRIVLLQTTKGDPLAVSHSVGEGTVIQFAISGNDVWSNLPLRPVYLPLVQQMVLDLAGKNDGTMITVGEPIVIGDRDWPKVKGTYPEAIRISYSARSPNGELQPVVQDNAISLTNTHAAGIYRFEKRVTDQTDPDNSESVRLLRIASVPAAESVLRDVQESRLASFAETLGATTFTDMSELRAADHARAYGREVWRWFLVALLVALVLELWLQQNLIARRRESLLPARGVEVAS